MDIDNFGERGTTVLELMITLIIGATLFAMAVMLWTPVSERYQAAAVQSNLQRAFTLARATAIHRRSIVTLCPVQADGDCSSDWKNPVAIFLDPDSLKAVKNDFHVINRLAIHKSGQLIPSNSGAGPRRYFQFNPDGTSKGSIGNLTWCPQSGSAERASHVRINFGGRLVWSRDTNGDGIVEDAHGNDIRC